MPRLRLLTPADARRVPWKNGRGVTEEIALGPPGTSFEADDYDWRVSRAAIVEDGPFSVLPGIERVLVVTDGAGLALTHGWAPRAVEVIPFAPHRFLGDEPTHARLLHGPVRDFNVLTRRGRRRAEVAVHCPGKAPVPVTVPRGDALVHAATGEIVVRAPAAEADGAREWRLAAGDSLLVADVRAPLALALSAAGPAVAIAVALAEGSA